MANPFFEHPILNSPYDCPQRHWELDAQGQPTQQIIENRRRAEFITPIPKPKKRKGAVTQQELIYNEGKGLSTQEQQYDPTSEIINKRKGAVTQQELIYNEGKGLSTQEQQYDPTSEIINEVRGHVDRWRALPNPSDWQVTPETARLLQHWRHHQFGGPRPFFCQVEAVETAIWLTEVAPESKAGKRFLFVIFGEPDIEVLPQQDGQVRVKVNGVDVFHPNTGEVKSDGADGIACWFIDTDYNEESFFVRHAYFLGANDPYSALKTTLKAEINEEAWATLNSDTSRPFNKPKSGRIAVKVINHLGDEVMKVFKV